MFSTYPYEGLTTEPVEAISLGCSSFPLLVFGKNRRDSPASNTGTNKPASLLPSLCFPFGLRTVYHPRCTVRDAQFARPKLHEWKVGSHIRLLHTRWAVAVIVGNAEFLRPAFKPLDENTAVFLPLVAHQLVHSHLGDGPYSSYSPSRMSVVWPLRARPIPTSRLHT